MERLLLDGGWVNLVGREAIALAAHLPSADPRHQPPRPGESASDIEKIPVMLGGD
jgi:hypothetical protein